MWQIIGHEPAVELLQQALAANRLAHAYLFVGPAQIGKTTLALRLAQALNCASEGRPCGVCLSCRKIARYMHPDVRIIEAEEGTIKISQMRELQHEAALSPYEGAWRVYIIPDFQQATVEAANCFLKTLEEPPPQVLLILTATDSRALLPTIVSRCQVISLRPLPIQKVAEALLESGGISQEEAALLARLSGGRIGWAIQARQDKGILQERANRLAALRDLSGGSLVQRMEYAQQICQKPEELPALLDLWISWWRDLLLVKTGCEDLTVNRDQSTLLQQDAGKREAAEIQRLIRNARRAKSELEKNANPRLAMEALLIDMR